MPGGKNASRGGVSLRDIIDASLSDAGFQPFKMYGTREHVAAEMKAFVSTSLVRACVTKNFVLCGSSIGGPHRVDYLLYHIDWPNPIAIYCAHQSTSGSATDKIAEWVLTITNDYPTNVKAMFILGGVGMPIEVIEHTKHRWVSQTGPIVAIYSLDEFREWVIRGCKYFASPSQPNLYE